MGGVGLCLESRGVLLLVFASYYAEPWGAAGPHLTELQMHEGTGRPLGNNSFLGKLEKRLARTRKPDRKPKRSPAETTK